ARHRIGALLRRDPVRVEAEIGHFLPGKRLGLETPLLELVLACRERRLRLEDGGRLQELVQAREPGRYGVRIEILSAELSEIFAREGRGIELVVVFSPSYARTLDQLDHDDVAQFVAGPDFGLCGLRRRRSWRSPTLIARSSGVVLGDDAL